MSAMNGSADEDGAHYAVGFRRPPLHTRFKPGQSGNPSGRAKGSKNLKTLFHTILNEQIALQDGAQAKKVTKAEAIMRRLIIGALKGDSRSLMTLMRIAEQTGEFEDDKGTEVVIRWMSDPAGMPRDPPNRQHLPAIRKISREGS